MSCVSLRISLSYLLQKNNYDLATRVLKALHMPVDPEFKPRMAEALKKTATKPIVKSTITDMRKTCQRARPNTRLHMIYLENLDQKATEALLELLTEENDRDTRIFLLDLLKDFGKDQFALLSDISVRSAVVRCTEYRQHPCREQKRPGARAAAEGGRP